MEKRREQAGRHQAKYGKRSDDFRKSKAPFILRHKTARFQYA
ncbi:hypothetical protein BCO26_1690 [Heyndrickxia coagulans 2-6]|nr:hypothetical protein BCO26_1690 [Heyndrickxia coagulans 2-6]